MADRIKGIEENIKKREKKIEDIDKLIAQKENEKKKLAQRNKVDIDKARTHRLIVRGAIAEKMIPGAEYMTGEEFKAYLEEHLLPLKTSEKNGDASDSGDVSADASGNAPPSDEPFVQQLEVTLGDDEKADAVNGEDERDSSSDIYPPSYQHGKIAHMSNGAGKNRGNGAGITLARHYNPTAQENKRGGYQGG